MVMESLLAHVGDDVRIGGSQRVEVPRRLDQLDAELPNRLRGVRVGGLGGT
jgi:hypothetical protein